MIVVSISVAFLGRPAAGSCGSGFWGGQRPSLAH